MLTSAGAATPSNTQATDAQPVPTAPAADTHHVTAVTPSSSFSSVLAAKSSGSPATPPSSAASKAPNTMTTAPAATQVTAAVTPSSSFSSVLASSTSAASPSNSHQTSNGPTPASAPVAPATAPAAVPAPSNSCPVSTAPVPAAVPAANHVVTTASSFSSVLAASSSSNSTPAPATNHSSSVSTSPAAAPAAAAAIIKKQTAPPPSKLKPVSSYSAQTAPANLSAALGDWPTLGQAENLSAKSPSTPQGPSSSAAFDSHGAHQSQGTARPANDQQQSHNSQHSAMASTNHSSSSVAAATGALGALKMTNADPLPGESSTPRSASAAGDESSSKFTSQSPARASRSALASKSDSGKSSRDSDEEPAGQGQSANGAAKAGGKKKGSKKNWRPLEIPVASSAKPSERERRGPRKGREEEGPRPARGRREANGDYAVIGNHNNHHYSSEGEGSGPSRKSYAESRSGSGGEKRWSAGDRRPRGGGRGGGPRNPILPGRGGSSSWRGGRRDYPDSLSGSGRVTPTGYDGHLDFPGDIAYYVDYAPITDPSITPTKSGLLSPVGGLPLVPPGVELIPSEPGLPPVVSMGSVVVTTASGLPAAAFVAPFYTPSTTPFITIPAQGFDGPSLQKAIRSQIEYYFSEENLQRDIFVRKKMDPEGYLPISLIASFHRVQHLTQDVAMVITALEDSELVELSENHLKARARKDPTKWPLVESGSPVAGSPSTGVVTNNNESGTAKGDEKLTTDGEKRRQGDDGATSAVAATS